MSDRSDASEIRALLALFAGALAIGSSGVFVRLSETGPTATAFWRGALALPLLAPWALLEGRARGNGAPRDGAPTRLRDPLLLWAGVFFAGDLALWHSSLLLTSIAVSTLESNCAPILVTLFAWALWRERPRLGFLIAITLAFAGMLLILAPKLGRGGHALLGDALGLGTAVFYAAYILTVARLRLRHGTGEVMFVSTLVFTLLLLPLALMQKFLPNSAHGWWLLLGCALLSQAFGQSLIAYALAHLPPTFGAVGLYVQVIAAAFYGWLQIGGGLVVLAAIALARRAGGTGRAIAARPPQPQCASIQSSAARHSESR
jgi:drug/metabolite transporter (DMT)-like permease